MKTNELEQAVLKNMIADPELKPLSSMNFEAVEVVDRTFTGAGFLTEFERSKELHLFSDGTSFQWGKIGARLNASKLETGYVVYVDGGYITAVEGYTYGDPWPERVEEIELYVLRAGMELATTPL